MRCIYQSLAMKYRYTFETLHRLTGKEFQHIHVIGGGIKDTLLCQLTADACSIPVLAGPAEATAMGNISVQLIAAGMLDGASGARKAVTCSTKLKQYLPSQPEVWEAAYTEFLKILQ